MVIPHNLLSDNLLTKVQPPTHSSWVHGFPNSATGFTVKSINVDALFKETVALVAQGLDIKMVDIMELLPDRSPIVARRRWLA